MIQLKKVEPATLMGPPQSRAALSSTEGALRFPADQRAGGGLAEVLQLLARHKLRLLAGALLGLCAGIGMFLISPSKYQARVVLQIQNPNSDFLDTGAVNSVANSPGDVGTLTDVATQIKIIESDQLLNRVIAKLQAEGQAGPLEAAASHTSLLRRMLHLKQPAGDGLAYRMQKLARPNLTVKQIGPTRAVEILYDSTDPVFAARFANTMAQQYIAMNDELRSDSSRRTEDSLLGELGEVQTRLKNSQDALQKYATSSGLLFVNGQHDSGDSGDISESKLSQLQASLSQAQADRIAAQSHFDIARTANPESLGDVLNDQSLRDLQAKLTDLRRQKAELSTIYTDANEKVQEVTAQILPLVTEFRNERASILSKIGEDYLMAERRQALLQQNYADQVRVVEGKEGESIQYSILKQNVDSNQKLYQSVLEQVQRAGIASAIRSNNIEIFDPATTPVMPYSPRPVLLGALGVLCGLLLASLFTFLTESSERRLKEAGELQGLLQLRELGAIPAVPNGKLLTMHVNRSKEDLELITWFKPRSFADEAYRALLTSILYAKQDGRSPRVIVVTSANPGEGKTTTACNLAVLMAELNQKVLLIDADLRRPRLHKVFATSTPGGLCDLLEEERKSEAQSFIQSTFVPNLSLLPSGVSKLSPTKLLHSEHLFALLQQLRGSYDLILIDAPPSLLTADARILGRSADAVLLVTRAGFTTCDEVETTAKIFAADGTHVLGTVLNDMKARRSNYNYYAAASV